MRVVGGLLLLVLAFADMPAGVRWGLEVYELVLGSVVLPGATVGIALVGSRKAAGPLRLTGPAWLIGNLVVVVALFANPYTAGAAALFYGVTLLVAAWVGQPGCEAMVLSNLVLGRDDELGCPALAPVDELDSRSR